ncbi:MAG: hypothetical protein VR65_07025 [Desulfobulbaceae bacterium BRH_c16a]|nr:MAG: hypothetical protein VR65_07025 [Desulfobulbaceae bacterium BRH_c16a]
MKALSTPAGIRKGLFTLLNVTQFKRRCKTPYPVLLQLSFLPIKKQQRFAQLPLDSIHIIYQEN